jgi:hypothetical protein
MRDAEEVRAVPDADQGAGAGIGLGNRDVVYAT